MDIVREFLASLLTLLVTLVFGFWLSLVGKPYNGVLFNIHKLAALAAVILAGLHFSEIVNGTNALVLFYILLVVAGVCTLALFATGAVMSIRPVKDTLVLTVHRVSAASLVVALAAELYLLGH